MKAPSYGIQEYDEFRAKVASLVDTCNFIPDVSTDEGYDKSKRLSLDVGKVLTAVESRRKDIKAPALERARLIDAEAKAIRDEIEAAQMPHKHAYQKIDDERKRVAVAAAKALEARIDEIRNAALQAASKSSAEIQEIIDATTGIDPDEFGELVTEAFGVKNNALIQLKALHETAQAKELADAEAAEAKAALDRQREEQEGRQRILDAEAAAERARQQQEQDERQRQLDDREAAIKAEEARQRAQQEAQERKEFEASAAKRAQETAERAVEEARVAAVEKERQEAAAAEERRQAELADQAAMEKLKPDLAKLQGFADKIGFVLADSPTVEHEIAQDRLDACQHSLHEAIKALEV